jgi:hypothetical protein
MRNMGISACAIAPIAKGTRAKAVARSVDQGC